MKRPTEKDREAWIEERYAELTDGVTNISDELSQQYHERACEDYDNMMADLAERARDERIDMEMERC
jgi:hypothetical protein